LAYVDSVTYAPGATGAVNSVYGRVTWHLLYRVRVASTPLGLSSHLSAFECLELVYDTGTDEALETVLAHYAAEQAVFYRRLCLCKALATLRITRQLARVCVALPSAAGH
jgi:hypothetical protein